ncbi:hypothetical protein GCM10009860_08510 [Microbacterium mitrae]|uniref:Uncharacterized protein n=1 Tax=Microbacterium mitrae TaxID=664640 RepID=A0A5C8HPY7_9MICO|nr:DUF6350 family protein [Microbacterium mitrae]TXK06200.1 hypothetical protein FVP60_04370 [Microbacterium mitrae]
MHRLLIALLAAFDAAVAAAVGLAAVLAPLTVMWALSLGATYWEGLWPATATIWQLGHHVPQAIELAPEYLIASGIPAEASSFIISLAPLAFLAFTVWSGARSGIRAARAGGWITGVVSGAVIFTLAAVVVEITSNNPIATSEPLAAILYPALAFAIPLLVGAVVRAWIDGDDGPIDALHDRVDQLPTAWAEVPALVVRGTAVVLLGFVAVSALAVVVSVIARGGEVIALYQASGVDAMGATIMALATFAYLPTLMAWALAWIAGPGIILGTGASVSPAATHLGVLPGLPPFGLVPEFSHTFLLAVVLLPIGIGVLSGFIMRSRYAAVLGEEEPYPPRIVLAVVPAAIAAGIAAAVFALASGSLGPGRMADFGPQIGLATLALFVEVGIGAAVMLLLPRGEDEDWESLPEEPALAEEAETLAQPVASDSETKPIGGAV